MPVVTTVRARLFKALDQEYTDEEFDELLFEYGLELDDITSEADLQQRETGQVAEGASTEVIYKIEVPANRYDLVCFEGLVRALRLYIGKDTECPVYKTVKPAQPLRLKVAPDTAKIRPYAVSAVLRNVTFTSETYQGFIDLQDKLHQNICRRRSLVAIGTHDLDTLSPPFSYEALPPTQIEFVPLKQTKSFRADELMQYYQDNDVFLRAYLPIIRDSPVYPIIYDSKRQVLSMPPIINSAHSAITLNTKNVFIECTATDLTKARIVINTIVAMYSQYCGDQFTVEQVEVEMPDGSVTLSPDMSDRKMDADVGYIHRCIGVPDLTADKMASLLTKMALSGKPSADGKTMHVSIPPTRSDILHQCDVMEDVAIAYGFNRIQRVIPNTLTVGKQQPVDKLTDALRGVCAMAGWTEVLTLVLCSTDEAYKNLRRPDDGKAVVLANPKTIEFQIARPTLLPGLLKTTHCNRSQTLPMRMFEISDVVLVDDKADVGARNERRLAAAYVDARAGFEVLQGLLDTLMMQLGIASAGSASKPGFWLDPLGCTDPALLEGRRANVCVNVDGTVHTLGAIGIVHPDVLKAYELAHPMSVIELDLTPFV